MDTTFNSLPHGLLHHVFDYLDAKDLCCVSATCKLWRVLNRDAAANLTWKSFYSSRWGVTQYTGPQLWQSLYGCKMHQLKSWSGKFLQDNLYGHKAGVRSVKLLPSHGIVVTGSLDKTVRLWSIDTGMPLSISKFHGGTVRALALDPTLLVSGSTEGLLRLWSCSDSEALGQPLFDLPSTPLCLRGHSGPISALSLTDSHMYSGSWDYTVRVWSRQDSWACASVLHFDDWVWSVAARGPNLLVSAGPDVRVHDLATGKLVRRFENLHDGNVSSLEGSHSGNALFTGAADGLVMAHDLRMRHSSVVLWHHNAAVNGLAFEDPWLASASSDGSSVLLDTDFRMQVAASSTHGAPKLSPHCRQLQTPGGPAYCVDLVDQWMACGCESEVVRVWDFSKAAAVLQRAAAARANRNSRRHRRRGSDVSAHSPPTDGFSQGRHVAGPRAPGIAGTGSSASSSGNSTPLPSPGTSPNNPLNMAVPTLRHR